MSKETYEIHSSFDEDVLRILISGSLVKKEAIKIAQAITKTIDQYKPDKVLIDCTSLTGRLGVAETFFFVREYEPSRHRPSRAAVLDNPENEDYFSFHETAGLNVGLYARFFGNLTEAWRWLHE